MKFTRAALVAVLGLGTTSAFVPTIKQPLAIITTTTTTTTSHHTHPSHSSSHRSTTFFSSTSFLSSTTVKDEELFKELDRNGAAQHDISDHLAAAQAQQEAARTLQSKPTKPREQLLKEATQKTQTDLRQMMKVNYEGLSGAAIVYLKVLEHGVDVVNGYSGGAVLPLLDQFHPDNPRHAQIGRPAIRWITNSNESSAGHIAEGYAKSYPVNGKHLPVGVVVATSGPGVTNLITPLQDAICDGVPMVVLCGQAATTAPTDAFQSAPAVEMTKPCTKWSYQIKSAAELPLVMDYAFFIATHGRPGPVFVDLPKDLQNQILTAEMIDSYVHEKVPTETANDELGMASLKTVDLDNGDVLKGIRLGYEKDGLTFELVPKADDEEDHDLSSYKLQPVSSSTDTFNADHHVTNRIFWTTNALTGEPERINKEGNLALDDAMTGDMVNFIKRAKKPVIIAGQGCNDSAEELKAFAEKLQIPVTTTLHALGAFDERHPLALNMMGMHGHPTPNFMVQEADLIINVGSRFDDRITGRMPDFVPGARKAAELGVGGIIHVDVRMSEKAKQIEPHFFVHSTGKEFLQTMNKALQTEPDLVPQTAEWLAHKANLERDFPITIPTFPSETITRTDKNGVELTATRTMMSAQRVVRELDRQLLAAGKMDEAIFTTGVGIHQMVAAQLITWTQPRQMLSSGSLGTMGVSLGYCIGAKLANNRKICISVDGDGSFNMTFTELKTVAEQNIPIKIMILDNESQMMVEYWQRLFHDARYLAVRNDKNPDYGTLASAFGIKSIFCDTEDEIEEKMREFLFDYDDEPVLFHVKIRRTPCLPLVAPGQPLDDMILEDIDVEVDQSAAPS